MQFFFLFFSDLRDFKLSDATDENMRKLLLFQDNIINADARRGSVVFAFTRIELFFFFSMPFICILT